MLSSPYLKRLGFEALEVTSWKASSASAQPSFWCAGALSASATNPFVWGMPLAILQGACLSPKPVFSMFGKTGTARSLQGCKTGAIDRQRKTTHSPQPEPNEHATSRCVPTRAARRQQGSPCHLPFHPCLWHRGGGRRSPGRRLVPGGSGSLLGRLPQHRALTHSPPSKEEIA